jgi:hypothetical protein
MRPNRTLLAFALMAIPLVGACKKKEAAPPPVVTEPTPPPPPPAPTATVELGSTSGPDGRVLAARTSFGTKDSIIASVYTQNTTAGSTLTAKWTFQTGQTVDSTSQAVAASPGTTKFFIVKKSGWPVGKYKVDVALNGSPIASQEFEVAK